MIPNNIYKKDRSIYNLVKNDIPIPEEYQNMDFGDLIDGITKNEIPIVYLFCLETDFTLYWPGKEPRGFHYNNKDWAGFVTTLQSKGKQAEREKYPVMVWCLWNENNSVSTRCRWCGAAVEKKTGKGIPFCKDTNCKDRYKKFQYLLRTLVKDGKITEFEKTCRLNPYISIIEDTQHNSYYLKVNLQNEFEVENEPLPPISDRCFFVTSDKNVAYALGKCPMCGRLYCGKSHSNFCTPECRYEFHNITNSEYGKLPSDLKGVVIDIPESEFKKLPLKLKNDISGFSSEIYKEFRKEDLGD